jgi:hypothetical protein
MNRDSGPACWCRSAIRAKGSYKHVNEALSPRFILAERESHVSDITSAHLVLYVVSPRTVSPARSLSLETSSIFLEISETAVVPNLSSGRVSHTAQKTYINTFDFSNSRCSVSMRSAKASSSTTKGRLVSKQSSIIHSDV